MKRKDLKKFKIAENDIEFIIREFFSHIIKKKVLNELSYQNNPEFDILHEYIQNNGLSVFPYKFKEKYNISNIEVHKNTNESMIYVIYEGYKIYLKKTYKSFFRAKRYFNNLLIEQDPDSPHRYVSDSFSPEEGDVIIDIGGAEGIFPLKYLDVAKKIYIFECNNDWVEALKFTYKDYLDKVEIIPLMVSDISSNEKISLYDFITNKSLMQDSLFIKIDAEGNEMDILKGFKGCITYNQKFKMAICSYHLIDAEENIREYFKDFEINNSNGYMFYYYDYNFLPPYYRRGVLRINSSI